MRKNRIENLGDGVKKHCNFCSRLLPLSAFRKNKKESLGVDYKCRECWKAHYLKNREQIQLESLESYRRTFHKRREKAREYYAKNRNKIIQQVKVYRESHKEEIEQKRRIRREAGNIKDFAREAVHWAVKSGRLKKQSCEKCYCLVAQAHHEDYTKPLEVVWLCKRCHEDRHIEINKNKQFVFKTRSYQRMAN